MNYFALIFSQRLIYKCRLRDGRSIRTVSALLLQLVQTSSHDVCVEARRIEKARQHAVALRRQESFSESQSQGRRVQSEEGFLDEHDQEVCHSILSSARTTFDSRCRNFDYMRLDWRVRLKLQRLLCSS